MTPRPRCPICKLPHRPTCRAVPKSHRWPAEPLVTAAGGVERVHRILDPGELHRAAQTGLTDRQADWWAIRLGFHPGEVWPDWFDVALRPLDAVHVREGWRPAWLAEQVPA